MTKDEFIFKLKSKLDVLDEQTFNYEIENFFQKHNDELKENKSLEEIIKESGGITEIAKNILKKHGINPEKVLIKKNFISQKLEELFDVIHRVVEAMSKNKAKENIKIIVDLLILVFLIALLKIPFILIQNIGESLLIYFENSLIVEIWALLIDLLYILVAAITFINVFTKWFKNIKVSTKLKIKALESVNLKEP